MTMIALSDIRRWNMSAALDMAGDLRCALDPVAFAAERLDFIPDAWQTKVLRSSGQNILLNCSRQAGKSTTTSIIALHTAFYQPARSSGAFLLRLIALS